jgi:hypothetical protein
LRKTIKVMEGGGKVERELYMQKRETAHFSDNIEEVRKSSSNKATIEAAINSEGSFNVITAKPPVDPYQSLVNKENPFATHKSR